MKQETIDARGLACPQPVILARKALTARDELELTVQADNETAKENLLRMAASMGCDAHATGSGEELVIHIRKKAGDMALAKAPVIEDCQLPVNKAGGECVFIGGDVLGTGADELGRLLIKSFLYALSEREMPIRTLALMNGGVRLALESSPAINDLKALVAAGVKILVCGTCLDYYGIKDQLAVGQVSNMYDIQEAMFAAEKLIRI